MASTPTNCVSRKILPYQTTAKTRQYIRVVTSPSVSEGSYFNFLDHHVPRESIHGEALNANRAGAVIAFSSLPVGVVLYL